MSDFYFNTLSKLQKVFYNELEKKLKKNCSFPIRLESEIYDEDAANATLALYLDKCGLLSLPPPHLLIFSSNKRYITIYKKKTCVESPTSFEIENCNIIAEQLIKEVKDDKKDLQHRYFLNGIVRRIHELSVYKLTDSGLGESPRDIFFFHSGYCTGFARTVKFICEKNNIPVICVHGKLRREYNAFIRESDEAHMFNAIYDNFYKKWFFFDPTSCINVASKKIQSELSLGFFRNSYAENYSSLIFYDLNSLKKYYVIDNEVMFK